MANVIVVVGVGQIGQAIARRVGVGKHVLLADLRLDNAEAAAEVMSNAGYEVSVATCDVSSRDSVHAVIEAAAKLGAISGLIRRRLANASFPCNDPEGRPVRHGPRPGGVRQRHRPRSVGGRHIVAVGPPPSRRSALRTTRRWRPPRSRSCSGCLCSSSTRSRTRCMRTSCQSARTRFA